MGGTEEMGLMRRSGEQCHSGVEGLDSTLGRRPLWPSSLRSLIGRRETGTAPAPPGFCGNGTGGPGPWQHLVVI